MILEARSQLITTQDSDNEIWKLCSEYYEVSNYGKVRSLDRSIKKKDGKIYNIKGRMLSLINNGDGYNQVSLGRSQKSVRVHRLVAESFLPNPNKKKTVNHKDGVKSNNHYSNLEWCSYLENNLHARVTGLNTPCGSLNPPNGTDHWNSRLDEVQVLTIIVCSRHGYTNKKLADYFNVSSAMISNIKTGKAWKHIQR